MPSFSDAMLDATPGPSAIDAKPSSGALCRSVEVWHFILCRMQRVSAGWTSRRPTGCFHTTLLWSGFHSAALSRVPCWHVSASPLTLPVTVP